MARRPTTSIKKGKGWVESTSHRITTVEQLLEVAQVDLSVWEVERATVNKWEVGSSDKAFYNKNSESIARENTKIVVEPLFQVKVWLKKKDNTAEVLKEHGDRLISKLEAAGKKRPKTKVDFKISSNTKSGDRNLLEIATVDLHMGKYANARETNSNYNMDIAEKLFRESTTYLLQKGARDPIDKILWPIGHDALHYATIQGTTPSGTIMDRDGRFFEAHERLMQVYVWAIEESLRVAPVELVYIPGNHDYLPSYHVARELAAWFRSESRVTPDVEPKPRKYREYGINMLGFTHGSEEKPAMLPTLMAKEAPEMWGRTRQREIHVGHLHLMRIYGESFAGVRIRILPTLTAHDHWHHKSGYQDRRASEAYLWNHKHGYAGHYSYNVNPS